MNSWKSSDSQEQLCPMIYNLCMCAHIYVYKYETRHTQVSSWCHQWSLACHMHMHIEEAGIFWKKWMQLGPWGAFGFGWLWFSGRFQNQWWCSSKFRDIMCNEFWKETKSGKSFKIKVGVKSSSFPLFIIDVRICVNYMHKYVWMHAWFHVDKPKIFKLNLFGVEMSKTIMRTDLKQYS